MRVPGCFTLCLTLVSLLLLVLLLVVSLCVRFFLVLCLSFVCGLREGNGR